jgi:serine protease Do
MKAPRPLLIAIAISCSLNVSAETVKDREGAVRKDRATMEDDPRWIYNDYQRGFAESRRSGKPLLVVLRCVPCLSCAGIDAGVLEEKELVPLLDQFVCVRVINANALDLGLFQFDYDLSFSTVFFNGDGTVYGRYGSWRHQKDPQEKTTAGYRRALEGVLEIHRQYTANKMMLAGKQGRPLPFKQPLEIPGLAGKYQQDLDWQGKVVQSCVHCHQISDGLREHHRARREQIPAQWIYPMPSPETIGLALSADEAAHVESVLPDSPAARAGLQPGDDILVAGEQPLVSIADLSWALHHAPANGSLNVTFKRAGASKKATLTLPAQWREKADISRRVATWPMRAMALGGLVLEDLNEAARRERGLSNETMALLVKHVGQYDKHAAAKKAGLQKDDVIVRLGAFKERMTESAVIGRLLHAHQPGEKIAATVLRGSEETTLNLPMQ